LPFAKALGALNPPLPFAKALGALNPPLPLAWAVTGLKVADSSKTASSVASKEIVLRIEIL